MTGCLICYKGKETQIDGYVLKSQSPRKRDICNTECSWWRSACHIFTRSVLISLQYNFYICCHKMVCLLATQQGPSILFWKQVHCLGIWKIIICLGKSYVTQRMYAIKFQHLFSNQDASFCLFIPKHWDRNDREIWPSSFKSRFGLYFRP